MLDLALTHEPAPQEWSPKSFAAEIGRRHGNVAQAAIEDLYRWAVDKERRLRDAGIRDVDLTRRPTSRAASPELWFQIDYTGGVPALMYTISIRASGDVVVQFQWMRQPPFDTADAHDELRRAFNEIDGIDLPADKVNGRPTFLLAVLEDPERRESVIRLLERIVDETRPSGGPVAEAEATATEPASP